MKISEALIQGKALIEKPEHWTKGAYARNEKGETRWSTDEDATCFCSLGAMGRVTCRLEEKNDHRGNSIYYRGVGYLEAAMGECVSVFNDEHAHAEVMAAWDKAIEAAKRAEAIRAEVIRPD